MGTVEGELNLEGRLHVGPSGRVSAKVRAGEVVVEGQIEGDVSATALTLTESAKARGTFVAKRLVVKEGATVEGAFNPSTGSEARPVEEKKAAEKHEPPRHEPVKVGEAALSGGPPAVKPV
jgi:cytoskeletal protein CcmA (bactofilin family)